MCNKLLLIILLFFTSFSFAQTTVNKFPKGKWLVKNEQISFQRNGKIYRNELVKSIDSKDAYLYNFVSPSKVFVSNLKNSFNWAFKLESSGNKLNLFNINNDAEDDESICCYVFDNQLVLKRFVEDSDPDDDNLFMTVITTFILSKI